MIHADTHKVRAYLNSKGIDTDVGALLVKVAELEQEADRA